MILFLQNIVRFVLLISIQVFVLNNIQFMGYINPYIYVLFILMLPVRFPRWVSLLLGFALGLIIDSFQNTPGMHASATVLVAFLRNAVIKLFVSIEEGANPEPSFYSFGIGAFVKYVVSLILLHHTMLFLVENFSFMNAGDIALKIIFNSGVSILLS